MHVAEGMPTAAMARPEVVTSGVLEMRYVGLVGLLIAAALVFLLGARELAQRSAGPSAASAVGAARRAAASASRHARDVLPHDPAGTVP
jgi:hypothetical protein